MLDTRIGVINLCFMYVIHTKLIFSATYGYLAWRSRRPSNKFHLPSTCQCQNKDNFPCPRPVKLARSCKQYCLLCPSDPWNLPGTALLGGFQSPPTVFDFYAGPSARGRQLYCWACNFKNMSALLTGNFYTPYWSESSATVKGYWHNKILLKRYIFSYDPFHH